MIGAPGIWRQGVDARKESIAEFEFITNWFRMANSHLDRLRPSKHTKKELVNEVRCTRREGKARVQSSKVKFVFYRF